MQIEFSPRGLLSAMFRQRVKLLLVFLAFAIGGTYYVMHAKPMYQASGSLLIKFGAGATVDVSRPGHSASEVTPSDRRELMQSNSEILQSHDLLLQVVKEIGVEKIYPGITERVAGKDSPLESAVSALRRDDLTEHYGMQSNVIDVAVTNLDPHVAEQFLAVLFKHFITRQSEAFNTPQTEFIGQQVAEARQRLEASQQKLQDYKTRNGISSIEEELQQLLKERGDTSTLAFEGLDEAQKQLADLKSKEAEMLMTYNAESPAVKQLRKSISLAQNEVAKRKADLRSRKQSAKKGILGDHVGAIDENIAAIEAKRSELNDLNRQVEIDEENFKNYTLRAEDARVSANLNQQNITRVFILNQPVAEFRPVRPRKKLVLGACLFAGLLLGLGTAVLFETMDERFSTPEQVNAALRVPMMASFARLRRR